MNNLKLVSFEVAKALKKFGYPQDIWKYSWFYTEDGELLNISNTGYYEIPALTYLEAWIWLWREKRIDIHILNSEYMIFMRDRTIGGCSSIDDPEEAIIAAIEYLVENNLIK